jgi:hypothetical protein
MHRVGYSVAQGHAHPRARALLIDSRSLTIDKLDDDGVKVGERPLAVGESESRLICGAVMLQERTWCHDHFTSMLPEDKSAWDNRIAAAETAHLTAQTELEAAATGCTWAAAEQRLTLGCFRQTPQAPQQRYAPPVSRRTTSPTGASLRTALRTSFAPSRDGTLTRP